jgi:hypothetical protein
MDLGILVYVDNNPQNIDEFFWLYKSVIHTKLNTRSKLIAVCHPDAIPSLPQTGDVITIPSEPFSARHDEWRGYGYINSVANLSDPNVLKICRQFEFILKTDCDTFVTPALKDFRPTQLNFGFGAYAYEESVRRKLSECGQRFGFPHVGLHNVGASLIGPSEMVCNYLPMQTEFCNRLLKEEFTDFHGDWPGWCKNVLTMYAGELALRATYPQLCSVGLLDQFPFKARSLGSDVLHVHAWHTDEYWSKLNYRAGAYDHMQLDEIDRTTLAGYCHWLAAAPLDEVRREAERID